MARHEPVVGKDRTASPFSGGGCGDRILDGVDGDMGFGMVVISCHVLQTVKGTICVTGGRDPSDVLTCTRT
jgi:hypothetical protein